MPSGEMKNFMAKTSSLHRLGSIPYFVGPFTTTYFQNK